jgi:hypothetical protein
MSIAERRRQIRRYRTFAIPAALLLTPLVLSTFLKMTYAVKIPLLAHIAVALHREYSLFRTLWAWSPLLDPQELVAPGSVLALVLFAAWTVAVGLTARTFVMAREVREQIHLAELDDLRDDARRSINRRHAA